MAKNREVRYQKQKEHFEWLRDKHEPPIRQADIRRAAEKSGSRQSLATTTTVGNWYRGEKQISRDNAEWLISEFWLDVTVEWLRGESDYMNENDMYETMLWNHAKASIARNEARTVLFKLHAELSGWSVSEPIHNEPYNVLLSDNDLSDEESDALWDDLNKKWVVLTRDGKPPVTLKKEDYEILCDKLVDFFDFELEHRERERINWRGQA